MLNSLLALVGFLSMIPQISQARWSFHNFHHKSFHHRAANRRPGSPEFCHQLNCPPFAINATVKEPNGTIEFRRYPEQLWARTLVQDTNLDDAVQIGFERLFQYISGNNTQQEKIDMTAPVLTYVQAAQGPFCKTNFTTSFYVPYKFQKPNAGPPAPTDPTVFLGAVPASAMATYAVLSFGGYPNQATAVPKAGELAQMLLEIQNSKQYPPFKFNPDAWYLAGYDPPFRVVGRHNEVWYRLEMQ